jgi:hypothetical protein
MFLLGVSNFWKKYKKAPSTTSDLLFSPLKYQKLLNGPPTTKQLCFSPQGRPNVFGGLRQNFGVGPYFLKYLNIN